MLHDTASACVIVISSLDPHARPSWFGRSAEVSGRSRTAGPGSSEFSVYSPVDSAAAAVTTLKTEPGGYSSLIVRLSSGFVGSLFRAL